jgi:predicted permease
MIALFARLFAAFRKKDLDREFRDELASHVELLTEENRRAGMPEAEARRMAIVKIGGLDAARDMHRDARGLPAFDNLLQDLRYTLRMLRKDAGFTMFAVLIVGLGIGASTTIFSVVNTLLLRPLPFRDPGNLVWIANSGSDLSGQTTQVRYMLDLQRHSQSFSGIAGYMAFYGVGDNKLTGDGPPERLNGVQVSRNFFSLLGVQPALGRTFTAEECKWNGPNATMLSHGLWERRFSSDPNIVGKKLILNDQPVTIVGVLPASFDFGSVFAPGTRVDLYGPFPLVKETDRWGNTMAMIGRLAPGANIRSAEAEATVLAKLAEDADKNGNGFKPRMSMLSAHVSGRIRTALLVLACAVGVVMLIVCANLSNLLLARTATRQKEIAIRAALGAGRWRLVRQMLTESVVLSLLGGILGLILAFLGTASLARLQGLSIPLLEEVHVDPAALGFTLLAAIFTGLVFGLVPALHVPGMTLHDSLKETGRGTSEGRGRAWVRKALVVSEVALASVLLVGAGLLIRSFVRVMDVNLGFQPERAATLRVDPDSRYSTQAMQNAYYGDVLRRVRDIPGVQGAGLTDALPLGRNRTWGAPAEGHVYTNDNFPFAFPRIASDGYLHAMGIPLKAGRDFTERDTPESEPVIIVNETMAGALWPGENALGKRLLGISSDKPRRVVGIVGDVRHLALEKGSGNEMYIPIRQTRDIPSVDMVVRATLPLPALASAVREALRPLDPNLPAKEFRPLETLVDRAVSPRRFTMILLGGFAAFALILASLGIYAVISYSVSQRTQEIGIRMALGATTGELQRGIVLQTLILAGVGILGGVLGSWMLARAIRSLLFGVTSNDPVTFLIMLAVLTLVAAVAGYLPARRASRIDPVAALRAA